MISEELLKHHKDHDDEIMSIIAHELGHWQMNHVTKIVVINIAYIVTFFALMIPVIDNDAFLLAFNFHHENYFIALFLFVHLFFYSVDVPMRTLLHVRERVHEY